MDLIFSITGLFSAFWWSIGGSIIKSSKIKNVLIFSFSESIISLSVISILISFTLGWSIFTKYSTSTYSYLLIGAIFAMSGTVFYIMALRKVPLGITFTVTTSIVMVITVILDAFINMLILNIQILLGGLFILIGIIIINLFSWKFSNLSDKSSYLYGVIFCIIAGSSWAFGIFFNDRGLLEADILTATTIRCVIPIIIFGTVLLMKNNFIDKGITKKEKIIILSSSLCITMAMLCWYLSLKANSAALTAILTSTSPVFAILWGILFYGEKLRINEIFGIILCLIGSSIIVMGK